MSRVNWEVTDTKGVIYVHLLVRAHGLRNFLVNGLQLCFAGIPVSCCGFGDRLKIFVDSSDPSHECNIQMVSAGKSVWEICDHVTK